MTTVLLWSVAPMAIWQRSTVCWAEPERDAFAVLDELWNVYKHRHLPLTQVWVGLEKAASLLNRVEVFDAPRGYADGLRKQLRDHALEIVIGTGRHPLTDGAELGTVREATPPYSWWPEMHLDAHLLVEIAFEEGPPAYGVPVQAVLTRIVMRLTMPSGQWSDMCRAVGDVSGAPPRSANPHADSARVRPQMSARVGL